MWLQNRQLLFALIAGICGWSLSGISAFAAAGDPDQTTVISAAIPSLRTDNATINEAFRIVIGDLLGNVQPFQDGLLERPARHPRGPALRHALDQGCRHQCLERRFADLARGVPQHAALGADAGGRRGSDWWPVLGRHRLDDGSLEPLLVYRGPPVPGHRLGSDEEFAGILSRLNSTVPRTYSADQAGATVWPVYPDGVCRRGRVRSILDWPKHNPDKVSKPGYGIPMQALSTNCLYYNAYLTADKMASELQVPADPQWATKAARLKEAINARLWLPDKGYYRFLVGPLGNCDHQEGLGAAYALLFGVADSGQAESLFATARGAGGLSLCVAQLQPVPKTGWAGVW